MAGVMDGVRVIVKRCLKWVGGVRVIKESFENHFN